MADGTQMRQVIADRLRCHLDDELVGKGDDINAGDFGTFLLSDSYDFAGD